MTKQGNFYVIFLILFFEKQKLGPSQRRCGLLDQDVVRKCQLSIYQSKLDSDVQKIILSDFFAFLASLHVFPFIYLWFGT